MSATEAGLRLRPLDLGEILDETFRMYRRRFLFFAGVGLAMLLPAAVPLVALFASLPGFSSVFSPVPRPAPTTFTDFNLAALLIAYAGFILYTVLSTPLLYGGLTFVACQQALGQPLSWGTILFATLRMYPGVLLYTLALTGMALLFCVFPLWIWIGVRWAVVMPAMVVERRGVLDAMGRSWRLLEGRWWRTFGILLLIFLLYYLVTQALTAFVQVFQVLGLLINPGLVLAVVTAGSELVSALTIPILPIAATLIYFDLRVRQEAIDLLQLADQAARS